MDWQALYYELRDELRELRVKAAVEHQRAVMSELELRGEIAYLERSRDEWAAMYDRAARRAAGVA